MMKNEELCSGLSEEIKQRIAACSTQEELRKVLAEAGVEPLDDALMDAVAGGLRGPHAKNGRANRQENSIS